MGLLSIVRLICMIALFYEASADIFLHNPRGSNNRLDEPSRNVRRNTRLFNSQNNDRAGYNVGGLYYYVGSTLQIEWTNQHSCGGPNNNCEIIIQYMCGDLVRDGATTTPIPVNNRQCSNNDCNTDFKFGMHEEQGYYLNCSRRLRNGGLFLADQTLTKEYATNTRQNANGKRYGYECQEERDYYPYWHPSPWIDIAVLSNNADRCTDVYGTESQNIKSRGKCVITPKEGKTTDKFDRGRIAIPNTEETCESFDNADYTAKWIEVPSHGKDAPDCREAPYSRDNHNGNGIGGYPNVYNWTIPDDVNERCVLRIRYNISTTDYDAWNTFDDTDINLEGNPTVQIFEGIPNFKLNLAINTAQFGRTFQDRSHAFGIRPRPPGTSNTVIHNLNVRGKRGNIVQVYPSVEYDFVPLTLEAAYDDLIHVQWTGSSTNPNNAGNGQRGTDRHNIVLLANNAYNADKIYTAQNLRHGILSTNYPTNLDEGVFLGLSRFDGINLAHSGSPYGDTADLDNTGPYYDAGLHKLEQIGTYNYMCTRNNDFTNRDQKGCVIVRPYPVLWEAIGKMGGQLKNADGSVIVDVKEDAFKSLTSVSLKVMSRTDFLNEISTDDGSSDFMDVELASHIYCVTPSKLKDGNGDVVISLPLHDDADPNNVEVFGAALSDLSNWLQIENVDFTKLGFASFNSDIGGCFLVRKTSENTRKTLNELLQILRRKYITK